MMILLPSNDAFLPYNITKLALDQSQSAVDNIVILDDNIGGRCMGRYKRFGYSVGVCTVICSASRVVTK